MMLPDEFTRLAARTRLKPIASEMARRVLVNGVSAAQAARELGRTRSEASRAAARIRVEARNGHACPECGRPF